MKKKLTHEQEFEIWKLVLDKFLWVGTAAMIFGLYTIYVQDLLNGIIWMGAGAVVFFVLLVILMKEYEFIKHIE